MKRGKRAYILGKKLTRYGRSLLSEGSEQDTFDFLSDAIVICKNNKIVLINSKAVKLIGVEDRKAIIGQDIKEYIYSDDPLGTIVNHKIRLIQQGNNTHHFNEKLIKSSGLIIDVQILGVPYRYKNADSVLLIMKRSLELKCVEKGFHKSECLLYKSQERYKKLADLSPNAIFLNIEEKIIYANEAAIEFVGAKSIEEIVGKSIPGIMTVHPDYKEIVEARIEQLNKCNNRLPYIEQKLIRRDGKEIYAEVGANSFLCNGKINTTIIARDVTDRKVLEERLRNSEEWHKKLLEFLPDALFVTDKWRILFVNKAGLKALGVDNLQKVVGKYIDEFFHPDDVDILNKRRERIYNGEKEDGFVEQRLVRESGEIIYLEVKSVPYTFHGQDVLINVAHDITNKKITERALKESEDRYDILIESSPDGIFIVDNKKILYSNPSGVKLFEAKSKEEVIGRDSLEFVHDDYENNIVDSIGGLLKDETNLVIFESQILCYNGEVKNIEVSNKNFIYKGKKVILSMARDITSRKKEEEAKRKLEETIHYDKIKTEFFSNISHELKTPLNIILGSVQLINTMQQNCSGNLPYKNISKYTNIMKQNCYRLLRLINNLIDITKADVGFLNMNFHNYNIVKVVEDIVLSIADFTNMKNIDIIFDTEVEEKIIRFDIDKIERVILNLLSNAIKFTNSSGTITVNIYDNISDVIISVKDTGVGIPDDMLESIFERFKQVDPLFTRNHEGSGIGLSLVKSIIESHEGEIKVKSKLGEGSEFIITLPATLVLEEEKNILMSYDVAGENVERIRVEFSDIYA